MADADIQLAKKQLRPQFKLRAAEFFSRTSTAELEAIHLALRDNLRGYLQEHVDLVALGPLKLAVYEPLQFELPIAKIIAGIPELAQAELLYPDYDADNMWFNSARTQQVIVPNLVIVPGLFADHKGHRLGRGKGYYDRYLTANHIGHAQRIFAAYDFQILESVPVTEYDAHVGALITPTLYLPISASSV